MRISDWSSDVCSSDLAIESAEENDPVQQRGDGEQHIGQRFDAAVVAEVERPHQDGERRSADHERRVAAVAPAVTPQSVDRSEERRVGNECVSEGRTRWSPCTLKKNNNKHKPVK